MLHILEQFHQLRIYGFRMLSMGVQKNTDGSVPQGQLRNLLALHLKGILIKAIPKQVKGRDQDYVGVIQGVEINTSRGEQVAVQQALIETAALREI